MALGTNVVKGTALINGLYKQMTGKEAITTIGTNDYISVANLVKQAPSNEILDAIGQVISRSVFAVRPYTGKFDFMEKSDEEWGGITRKFSPLYVDPAEDDNLFFSSENPTQYWADGESADQWEINKPKVAQFNYYGSVADQYHLTRYEAQLKNAFRGPEEMSNFLGMIAQETENNIQSKKEARGRATMLNFIGGKLAGDTANVIHCITLYNDETDHNITESDLMSDTNFVPFVKWLYAKIQTISEFMTERTTKYHMNVTGKEIVRHTPKNDQFFLMNTGFWNSVQTNVITAIFNDGPMKDNFRKVNYWQSIDTPMGINIKPSYLDVSNGTVKDHNTNVTQGKLLGMLYDRDAFGFNNKLERVLTTTLNARSAYYNTYFHYWYRYFNDFTENCVLFVLD